MSSNQDYYNNKIKELEAEKNAVLEFMELFVLFKQMDYDQAVEYMNKNFGEVGDGKTIYFGSKCSLEITLDKRLGVYHFHFNGDDLDYKLLETYIPDWEEKVTIAARNALQQAFPEQFEATQKKLQEAKTQDSFNITSYSTYNNIKIDKKKAENNEKSDNEANNASEE